MRKFGIVAWHTFCKQVKSWSFLFLILGPFLMILISFGAGYLEEQGGNDGNVTYAVVSNQSGLSTPFAKDNAKNYVDNSIKKISSAKKSLKNDDIDGYVQLEVKNNQVKAFYHGTEKINPSFKVKLQTYLIQIQSRLNFHQAKLSTHQIQSLEQKPQLTENVQTKRVDQQIAQFISFFILIILMYVVILVYSSITAQEIASEKGSKVVEVVLSSISAGKYFAGKITGILGVAALQFIIYLVAGAVGFNFALHSSVTADFMAQNKTMIDQILHNLLGVDLLYVLLGIVLFIVVSAYCGALVKQEENASKAVQPVVIMVLIIFIVAMIFMNKTKNPAVVVLSYVPGFSSFMMPLRLIAGTANAWECVISLFILLGSIGLLLFYLSKSYKKLILQADNVPFWRKKV